jgi:Flagellar hook-length control protein FliK.
MPDDKFNNTDRFNPEFHPANGGIGVLSNPDISTAQMRDSSLTALSDRYKATQELLTQISRLQGRLPPEIDQKLQSLLQQLTKEWNTLGESLSANNTQQAPQTDISSNNAALTTDQQLPLRQLASLLSQQSLTTLPAELKTNTIQQSSADVLFTNLTKLIQLQPSEWQLNNPLGKSLLNWLLQSQLAIKSDNWSTLPQKAKSQLLQSGIMPPSTVVSVSQRQFIQQLTSQIFGLLIQQKNQQAAITSLNAKPANILTNQLQEGNTLPSSPDSGKNDISNTVRAYVQQLSDLNKSLPPSVKDLVKQIAQSLDSLLNENSKSTDMLKTLLKNPLIDVLNQRSTKTEFIDSPRLQQFLDSILSQTAIKPTTNVQAKQIITNINALPIAGQPVGSENIIPEMSSLKIENTWGRLLLQLISPQIFKSPEISSSIKDALSQQIWTPNTEDEQSQFQTDISKLKNITADFVQELNTALTKFSSLNSNTIVVSGSENITAIQAMTRDRGSVSTESLQLLLTTLRQAQLGSALATDNHLQTTLSQLIAQLSTPLTKSEDIHAWLQFLLKPLDSDSTYTKSLQKFMFQLLQARENNGASTEQNTLSSFDILQSKEQLTGLDKLVDQTLGLFKLSSQPMPQDQIVQTSGLQIPIPPRAEQEEFGSLNLQRNTKDDPEKGWNISLYLEPVKLGSIRFQARIALPDVTLSIVAEKASTVTLIKQTYPLLEQRFQQLGLTPKTLQIRQGKTRPETSPESSLPNSGISITV